MWLTLHTCEVFLLSLVPAEYELCEANETAALKGKIISPNYPYMYPNNVSCDFTLRIREDVTAEIELGIKYYKVSDYKDKFYVWTQRGAPIRKQLHRLDGETSYWNTICMSYSSLTCGTPKVKMVFKSFVLKTYQWHKRNTYHGLIMLCHLIPH